MATRQRPLSPHLQVYRWQIQMVTSILHRATGIVLTLGAVLIALALLSLASGPEGWHRVGVYARSVPGLLILFGWTWAYLYHLLNGVRHLAHRACGPAQQLLACLRQLQPLGVPLDQAHA
jgi:succinate dehydrogenase / fumarate reductase cytochrome b subunit